MVKQKSKLDSTFSTQRNTFCETHSFFLFTINYRSLLPRDWWNKKESTYLIYRLEFYRFLNFLYRIIDLYYSHFWNCIIIILESFLVSNQKYLSYYLMKNKTNVERNFYYTFCTFYIIFYLNFQYLFLMKDKRIDESREVQIRFE